jgi:glutamine amidotransferase-like uncharacterized protein
MSESDKTSRRLGRRGFLVLLAGSAYLLLDGIYGGPVTLAVRSVQARPGIGLPTGSTQTETGSVAVYSGEGTWDESVQAAGKLFESAGYSVAFLGPKEVEGDALGRFNIICVPGGDMYQYAQEISSTGREKLRSFVRDGGGYIGICGGAYFASEQVIWNGSPLPMIPLAIFPGKAEGPLNEIAPYPNYAICDVNIVDLTHPITESEPTTLSMLYYWGPALRLNADAQVSVLARYEKNNAPAILAFDYGLGRVFLVGTHPEIGKDSSLTGVSFPDSQHSGWDLTRKASLWCSGRI